jgi:hypothetical protein
MSEFIKTKHRKRFGRCFELSGSYLFSYPAHTLVHGTINSQISPVAHAWIESENGFVYDLVDNQEYPIEEYYQKKQAEKFITYSVKEAAKNMVESMSYGPWDENYRNIPGLVHN